MVSESLDRTLSVRERFGLKLHLFMCGACKRVIAQMELLRAVARRWDSAEVSDPDPEQAKLSKAARARISERLHRAQQTLTP